MFIQVEFAVHLLYFMIHGCLLNDKLRNENRIISVRLRVVNSFPLGDGREMRERAKSGARTKKARGGRGEVSASPLSPLSRFLSSPHFLRALASLEV